MDLRELAFRMRQSRLFLPGHERKTLPPGMTIPMQMN